MNPTCLSLCIASLLLGISVLRAEPSPYEYKVATTELALLAFDKSSEPLVKKWAQKHRPKLYAVVFVEQKEDAKAEEDKGLLGAFVAAVAPMSGRSDLYLDYYLNQQAEEGWEPFQVEEKSLILRRKRPEG